MTRMKPQTEDRYVPALSFDFLTPFYDLAVKLTTREKVFKERLVGRIEIPPDGRLLDLACGTGTLTIAIERRFPAATVHGLDGDSKILRIARGKASSTGTEINFTEAFSTALPYPDGYFDSVVSSLFFHHLTPENKRKTLLEVRRVLGGGGTLHVADWGQPSNSAMSLASMPVRWLDGATTRDSCAGKLPGMMEEAGFTSIVETDRLSTVFGTLRLHRSV